jgi:hypothetical protein
MAYRDAGQEENYWNSGLHGNKEDYENYLLIKQRLEGKAFRPPKTGSLGKKASVLSFYPSLKWALAVALFIDATRIALVCQQWSPTASFAIDIAGWSAALLVTFWYFAGRDTREPLTLLECLPDVPSLRSVPYWAFLLGWILMWLNPNDFKIWAEWVARLSSWLGTPLEWSAFLSSGFPRMPILLKSLGGLLTIFGGGFLILDAFISRYVLLRE